MTTPTVVGEAVAGGIADGPRQWLAGGVLFEETGAVRIARPNEWYLCGARHGSGVALFATGKTATRVHILRAVRVVP